MDESKNPFEDETIASPWLSISTPQEVTGAAPPALPPRDPWKHDIGGPYGEQGTSGGEQVPPGWMRWWAAEQGKMLSALVGQQTALLKRMETPREENQGVPRVKLAKMTKDDDPEAFLRTFERVAGAARWPRQQWAAMITPQLTGVAQQAVDTLEPEEAADYERVKQAILGAFNITAETYRQRLRATRLKAGESPRMLANHIKSWGLRWLEPKDKTKEQVVDAVLLEQFLHALPTTACAWVMKQDPEELEEAVRLMEVYTSAEKAVAPPQRPDRVESTARRPGPAPAGRALTETPRGSMETPRRSGGGEASREVRDDRGRGGGGQGEEGRRQRGGHCFGCGSPDHYRRDCPQRGGSRNVSFSSAQVRPPKAPLIPVQVNGVPGTALIDSGCSQTMIRSTGSEPEREQRLWIRCVHGDVRPYQRVGVTIKVAGQEEKVQVGVAPQLKYEAIIGRDFPKFFSLLEEARKQEANLGEEERRPGQEEHWDGPTVKQAQLEDPSLTKAWEQARQGYPTNFQGPRFEVQQGLLYRRGGSEGKPDPVDQLVLPQPLRGLAMALAHENPLAGHMGEKATTSRLLSRFYWPGIHQEIRDFCETCQPCQFTQVKGPPGGELKPLPIIDVPFKRIAMDLIGPLPRGKGGFEYALVIIDYATRYPEAVPLRNTQAPTLARELLKVFTRLGFPQEILTDQGQNFMGRVMAKLWEQVGVAPLKTSVYHPQGNGLVERFNKTLKQMITKFAHQDPAGWPQLIEPLLFAVREVPQASLGFSPFELMFGRKPRGILDLARNQWGGEEPQGEGWGPMDVGHLRQRLLKLAGWAREQLKEAQASQKRRYDQRVRLRVFQPGDQVLLLLPTSEKKLIAKWQGPFEVLEKMGEVNYRIKMPGRRPEEKVFHVNLLKKWRVREVNEGEHEDLGPSVREVLKEAGDVVAGEELSNAQRKQIADLQTDFRRVFSNLPGKTHLEQHAIKVQGDKIVRLAPRQWPKHMESVLAQEVKEMAKLGVIEPSRSDWRSYPVLVPKGDGSTRVCLDFRKVNEVSRFDAYPMPRVTELLEKLGGAQYLSTIDLTKGYWQIPLEAKSREYTAFATPIGLYQFTRMPFGLHGAAATFQRLMDKVLAPHQAYAAAYIDDVIIYSDSWDQHLQHLRKILESLGEAGLTVNPAKCHIGMKQTKFLGFLIGKGEIRPLRDKVEAINRIQPPRNKKEVQRLLGMIGYYRRFIPRFSELAAPITDLTRGKGRKDVQWTEKCSQALAKLKKALTSPPVLRTPDFDLPFVVHTDASGRGLGAVLSQRKGEEERPILFLSRKLNEAEQKYSTIEREALAIKWATEALRYYLLGAPFTLVTDHAPLTWLQRMKDSNARLTRWYLGLQPFSFRIEHRKGTDHTNADFLSRQENSSTWQPGDVAPVLPGGECGEGRLREEAELTGDLMWLEPSSLTTTITTTATTGIPAQPTRHRRRWHPRAWGLTWKPAPTAGRGRLPGTPRVDPTTVWWLQEPPPPSPEWWDPPAGRGIWRE